MEMNGTTLIARPVDMVFDYVVNPANDASWRTGVDESGWQSDGPPGPGAIGYTVAGNQRVEWRVFSYVPGESADWEVTSGPFKGRAGYQVAPADGGTRFTLVADIEPLGWLRLLGPVFTWMVRRQNQESVEKLRDILDSMPEPDSQG